MSASLPILIGDGIPFFGRLDGDVANDRGTLRVRIGRCVVGLVVGLVLAIATGILGRTAKFDRDRAFYPTITIVIATYYILFAAMGSSSSTPSA